MGMVEFVSADLGRPEMDGSLLIVICHNIIQCRIHHHHRRTSNLQPDQNLLFRPSHMRYDHLNRRFCLKVCTALLLYAGMCKVIVPSSSPTLSVESALFRGYMEAAQFVDEIWFVMRHKEGFHVLESGHTCLLIV